MTTAACERLGWLRYQIRQGWQVEGPVLERAVRAAGTNPQLAFEFVLRHDVGYQAIAVPDSPELRSFLREQALPVVSL